MALARPVIAAKPAGRRCSPDPAGGHRPEAAHGGRVGAVGHHGRDRAGAFRSAAGGARGTRCPPGGPGGVHGRAPGPRGGGGAPSASSHFDLGGLVLADSVARSRCSRFLPFFGWAPRRTPGAAPTVGVAEPGRPDVHLVGFGGHLPAERPGPEPGQPGRFGRVHNQVHQSSRHAHKLRAERTSVTADSAAPAAPVSTSIRAAPSRSGVTRRAAGRPAIAGLITSR